MSISKVTVKSGNKITIKYPGPQGPAGAGGGPGGGSGDVVGPASSVSGNLPTFSGTTGKVIQDGGVSVAAVRDRATHTGEQAIATVTGLQTALDGKEAVGVAASALAAHVAAADPHPTYALDSDLTAKANLASPTFTGTPAAPTAAADVNTTQIATTAFVQQEIANDTTRALASHQHNASDINEGTLAVGNGGTGLTAAPANGQLAIGNGTGFTLATLTAGTNITITNSAGGIKIDSTGGGGSSPTTTQGDMIARGSSADQRLPIGRAGALLASDGTDPGYLHPVSHYFFVDDFDGTSLNPYSTGWQGGGTSGTTALLNGEAGAPGIFQLSTTNGATNSRFMHRGNVALMAGGGVICAEWRVRIPTLSVAGSEAFTVRVGLHDSTSAAPTDGLWFEYTDATNSGQWQVKASSNSTASTTNTTSAPAANTWYRLKIVVNAAGTSAEFFVDDVSVGTVTSNIPTGSGRVFGPNAGITKTQGTTARLLDLDFFWIFNKLTTAR